MHTWLKHTWDNNWQFKLRICNKSVHATINCKQVMHVQGMRPILYLLEQLSMNVCMCVIAVITCETFQTFPVTQMRTTPVSPWSYIYVVQILSGKVHWSHSQLNVNLSHMESLTTLSIVHSLIMTSSQAATAMNASDTRTWKVDMVWSISGLSLIN